MTILITILILNLFSAPPRTYLVIYVKGDIIHQASGKKLEVGKRFNPNDNFEFKSPNATASLAHEKDGIVTLKEEINKSNSFISTLRALFNSNPPQKYMTLASMSDNSGRLIKDTIILSTNDAFFKYFSDDRQIIINNDKHKVRVDTFNFSLNPDRGSFLLKFKYNDRDIEKEIKHTGDALYFSKDYLFQVTLDKRVYHLNEKDVVDLNLYYNDRIEKKIFKICPFNVKFPDESMLKKSIQHLVDELKRGGKEKVKIVEDVLTFINKYYGKPDAYNTETYLMEIVKL